MRGLLFALTAITVARTSREETQALSRRHRKAARGTSVKRGSSVLALLAIGAVVVTLVPATKVFAAGGSGTPGAANRGSVYVPAPGYPNSRLAIDLAGRPRAGQVASVVVSGSNAPFELGYPGSGEFLADQLDAFVQNAKIAPRCPRTFAEELQNQVNLGASRIGQGLSEGYRGAFRIPLRFRTSRSVRTVVICAYSRLVTDDAAVSALRFKLRRP